MSGTMGKLRPRTRVPRAKPSARAAESGPVAKRGAGVFQRAFGVLEYVVRAGRPVAASDIAEALSLPKPTVYRMIEGFEEQGLLHRHFASRRVGIGPRLADFSFDVIRASVRYAPRRIILNALVEQVNETCNIGALEGGEIVYLDRVEATHWPLRLHFHIGSRVPLHCTAIGKLFLAYLPPRGRRNLLDALDLRQFTPNTITDAGILSAELQQIASEGLSIDREEYIVGVICVAAPIFNAKQEICAGVAVQAPAARMSVEEAVRHRDTLALTARALGQSFAFE